MVTESPVDIVDLRRPLPGEHVVARILPVVYRLPASDGTAVELMVDRHLLWQYHLCWLMS